LLDIAWQPQGEHGFQPLGAGQIGRQPDLFQRLDGLLLMIDGGLAPSVCLGPCEALETPEDPDRMLAMTSTGGTVRVQNLGLFGTGGSLVA
jgi:hypothetical protein